MTTRIPTTRPRSSRWLAALLAVVAAVGLWRTTGRAATPPVSLAKWTAPIGLPLVPVGAAILPTGNVLFWASNQTNNFTANGNTQTVIFDPTTNAWFAHNVTETGHNMFCPGTAMLPDGRLFINGGYDAPKTSIYDPATNAWSTAPAMSLARGYNGSTLLSDGSVLTLGGAWSGGSSPKGAEVFTRAGTWRSLSGVPDSTEFMINGTYSSWQNNAHYNLIPTGNGQVLLTAPGPNMFWINPNGNGSYTAAGPRGDDGPAFSANTVMFDAGRILKVGGSTWNTGGMAANASAYVIDTTQGAATVTKLPSMAYARGHHNSVVLPNGQVIVIGGQTQMEEFSDAYAVLAPELFDPATNTFTVMPSMSVARNYHSIALLLPDGRVLSGGGGLCACAGDHQDVQLLSPPYLFNADGSAAPRPVITSTPSTLGYGTTVTVATNAAVNAFSLVRLNATTHGVNNDQRRVSLSFTATDATHYQVSIPSNPGILLPGKWMLFAMNSYGTPSMAAMVTVDNANAPAIVNPGSLRVTRGTAMNVPVTMTTPSGTLTVSATGLPAGVTVNSANGTLSGTPTTNGRYLATLRASNGTQTVSTDVVINVVDPVVNVTLTNSAAFGSPTTGTAFTDSVAAGQTLTGALVRAGSWLDAIQGLATPSNLASHGGAGGTTYTATWGATDPLVRIYGKYSNNLISQISFVSKSGKVFGPYGANQAGGTIRSFDYTVPAGNKVYGFFGTADGYLRSIGVRYGSAATYRTPSISALSAQQNVVGAAASVTATATDPDGNPLTFSATGLPNGISINGTTGVMSGTPTTVGTFTVTVAAGNAGGFSASTTFTWTILAVVPQVTSLSAPIATAGVAVSYAPTFNAGGAAGYGWSFGDGSPSTSSVTAATTHVFATPGVYSVTLTIGMADGRTGSYTFLQAVVASGAGAASASRSSTNILLAPASGSAARLWVVNQDNDSVSVFDSSTNARLAEVAVGAAPRTLARAADGRIWVANKASATISIVSPSTNAVVQTLTLPRASQPFGIVISPTENAAFVALEAIGRVVKLDATSGAQLASFDIGGDLRHLTIDAAGANLYVSRFITRPLPGENTAVITTTDSSGPVGGEVLVLNAATLAQNGSIVLAHSERPDGSASGAGIPNYLGAPVISPDGTTAWVPSKQDNVKRGSLRNGVNLDFKHTVRAISSRVNIASGAEDLNGRLDFNLASIASAAVYHPSGAYLFVALEGNRQVAVVDAARGQELFRYWVGLAPQGLVLSADGRTLFVNNFMSRTISALDISQLLASGLAANAPTTTVSTITTDKLTPTLLAGKQLFYDAADPRLTRDSYMSCASCHNDGGHDGRVWDLTGLGEGLRNTINLRGRAGIGQGFLHWSANFDEIQDFEGQIRALAGGTGLMTDAQFNTGTRSQTLGDPKAGVSADLDALAAYVNSLTTFDASPYRNTNGTLTAAAAAGKTVFTTQRCATCHGGAGFTLSGNASQLKNVGTITSNSGTRLGSTLAGIDIPTLRDVWSTAPYLHDGSAPTLALAISRHNGVVLSAIDLANVAEYVRQIGSEEPAAGAVNVSLAANYNVWSTFTDGTAVTNGGLDNNGYAFSSTLLGSTVSALGGTFSLGAANVANAVANATVTLPAGSYNTLTFLAAGTNGNQANQVFKVTYTDNTTTSFTQSISDWFTPQNYAAESTAVSMAYRLVNTTKDNRTFRLYGYTLTLNSAKQVKSITLPANRNVIVLGVNLQ